MRVRAWAQKSVRSVLVHWRSSKTMMTSVTVALQVAKMNGAGLIHSVGQSVDTSVGLWISHRAVLVVTYI